MDVIYSRLESNKEEEERPGRGGGGGGAGACRTAAAPRCCSEEGAYLRLIDLCITQLKARVKKKKKKKANLEKTGRQAFLSMTANAEPRPAITLSSSVLLESVGVSV